MTAFIASIMVLAVFAIFFVRGWKKGFLRIILTTLSLLATMVVAAFLLQPATDFLTKNTKIETALEKRLEAELGFEKQENSENDDTESIQTIEKIEAIEKMEDGEEKSALQEKIINGLSLSVLLKNALIEKNTASEYIRMGVESFKQYIIKSIAGLELKIITYIGLVLAIFIFVRILLLISKLLTKIPVIKGANKFFGGITGLIEGLLILWIVGLIISLLSQTDFGIKATKVIQESFFLDFLYEENPIIKFIGSLFTIT